MNVSASTSPSELTYFHMTSSGTTPSWDDSPAAANTFHIKLFILHSHCSATTNAPPSPCPGHLYTEHCDCSSYRSRHDRLPSPLPLPLRERGFWPAASLPCIGAPQENPLFDRAKGDHGREDQAEKRCPGLDACDRPRAFEHQQADKAGEDQRGPEQRNRPGPHRDAGTAGRSAGTPGPKPRPPPKREASNWAPARLPASVRSSV